MRIPKIINLLNDKIDIGVNLFSDIRVRDKDVLDKFIKAGSEEIRHKFSEKLPSGFASSRIMYRSLGIDPTRYRPSSEALWRRVKKGLAIPQINPFVDITNFLSLKFQISFGLYDAAKIEGAIILKKGSVKDVYEGIRKENVNLDGKIGLFDSIGAFGNPSSDSLRTSTSESTKDILQVLFFCKNNSEKDDIFNKSVSYFENFFLIERHESCFC